MSKLEGRAPSLERRRFLHVSARYGYSTAVVAAAGGYLWNDRALAQTAADEEAKERGAKYRMIFATEQRIEDSVRYPVMQAELKQNVEAATKNQIFVKLFPAGQLGMGAQLAQKVQAGTLQGCSTSLSNLSPYAPAVDLVNIPFWCGRNQQFANLVTSKAWNDEITPKVAERGYKPMFYFTADARTIAVRKGFPHVIKTPADMKGMKMRVPPSQLLQTFYRLAGANPTVVPWGETATAMKQGVADGLDPAVTALSVYGFHDLLAWVTFVQSVPDAQMFAANSGLYRSLSADVRAAFDDACAKTVQQAFAQLEVARGNAVTRMRENGAQFYVPMAAEYQQWIEACGPQRKEWDDFKLKLVGSPAAFDKLMEAANTQGPITVADPKI